MMATTHALVGMSIALPVAYVAPELAPNVLLAGLAGGLFPDLDLYAGHRRTLHYPVCLPVVALVALAVAALAAGPVTVGVAAFLLAAAVHSTMDAFGGASRCARGSRRPTGRCTTTTGGGGSRQSGG